MTTPEWARNSILATLDEVRATHRILGLPAPDEAVEAVAIIQRIEARLAQAKTEAA